MDVIKTQGTDMTTPLVDREGFPRADIDVAGVRTARARIHRLRNDLKDAMDAIAAALENVYARPDDAGKAAQGAAPEDGTAAGERPFALVNGVAPGSPAEQAVRSHLAGHCRPLCLTHKLQGLRRTDKIVRFGSLHAGNHNGLQALPSLVESNEGVRRPEIQRVSTHSDSVCPRADSTILARLEVDRRGRGDYIAQSDAPKRLGRPWDAWVRLSLLSLQLFTRLTQAVCQLPPGPPRLTVHLCDENVYIVANSFRNAGLHATSR
jgi:hypothetical protein